VTLAARDPDKDLVYGSGELYFLSAAQSPFFLDLNTRERRAATLEDLIQCVRICDYLDEVDEFCPMVVPTDVPPVLRGLKAGITALENTSKHILKSVDTRTLPFHLEVLDAVLGHRDRIKDRPIFSQVINDISPLQKDGDLVDATLGLSEYRVPITLYFMPMAGGTAPVTLAGTLLEMTASMLSSVVLYQHAQPGWPIIYGAGAGTLDMRTGRYGSGAESTLMSVAPVEMARFYGLPCLAGGLGAGDSKQINFQAGVEAMMGSVFAASAGADAIWGPADLDGGTLVDLPWLVLATEVVRQIKRLLQGIVFDEQHFLFDVIAKMRFEGEYLGDRSTKQFFREEHLLPDLFPRESYGDWEERGQSEEQIGMARVKEILRSHEPEPLPEEVGKELEHILAAAHKELAQ
jgi:trimethylamine--corrinoid protein Co-methyltransferase